jgi:hypothetical protein
LIQYLEYLRTVAFARQLVLSPTGRENDIGEGAGLRFRWFVSRWPIPTPTATLSDRTLHRFTRRRLLSVFIGIQWPRWVEKNIRGETDWPPSI